MLGKGEVIKGWDQGLQGMKVGGRRRLVIPADLAYGPTGQPPSIAPNDTLVFIVDLTKVANPPPTTTAPPTTAAPSTTAPPPPRRRRRPPRSRPPPLRAASTTAPSTSR